MKNLGEYNDVYCFIDSIQLIDGKENFKMHEILMYVRLIIYLL